jgi:hypothetical protein
MAESAAGKKADWLPLEADPGLMSTYLHKLGADPNELYTFHDVYGVDDEMLGMVPQPVLAVLLLFPISDASEAHKETEKEKIVATGDAAQKVSPNLYYMHQVRGTQEISLWLSLRQSLIPVTVFVRCRRPSATPAVRSVSPTPR